MTAEMALYLILLLYVVILSGFNCAASIRIFIILKLPVAFLLAVWPLTTLVPTAIEVSYLFRRIAAGTPTLNMPSRWANLAVLAGVATLQFLIITFSGTRYMKVGGKK